MKTNAFSSLLLLLMIALGCSESSSSDPDPAPAPPDYSSCRYSLKYSLRYSPLNSAKPVTLSYLDSTQKLKTVMLKDTSLDLAINYKYGDSVYVRFSRPYIYFANKTGNKLAYAYTIGQAVSNASCPVIIGGGSYGPTTFRIDSIMSTIVSVSSRRLAK